MMFRLNTNVAIYDALRGAYNHGDVEKWDDVDRFVARMFLADFEQSGIHLPEQQVASRHVRAALAANQNLQLFQRKEFVEINNHIMLQGNGFEIGCSTPKSVKASALPSHVRAL